MTLKEAKMKGKETVKRAKGERTERKQEKKSKGRKKGSREREREREKERKKKPDLLSL